METLTHQNGTANGVQTFLRPLADIYADLKKEPASRHLFEKDTGKFKATYMPHYYVKDYLDQYAPGWEWVTSLHEQGGLIYVSGTLIINGSDGRVARDGIGNENDAVAGFGDPSSNAEAMALRRAAMAHGFCRNLWRKG